MRVVADKPRINPNPCNEAAMKENMRVLAAVLNPHLNTLNNLNGSSSGLQLVPFKLTRPFLDGLAPARTLIATDSIPADTLLQVRDVAGRYADAVGIERGVAQASGADFYDVVVLDRRFPEQQQLARFQLTGVFSAGSAPAVLLNFDPLEGLGPGTAITVHDLLDRYPNAAGDENGLAEVRTDPDGLPFYEVVVLGELPSSGTPINTGCGLSLEGNLLNLILAPTGGITCGPDGLSAPTGGGGEGIFPTALALQLLDDNSDGTADRLVVRLTLSNATVLESSVQVGPCGSQP